MASVLELADREYNAIQSGRALQRNVTAAKLAADFDFLTSEESKAGPVHIVEIAREDARRAKAGDAPRDLSREEFAKNLGISEADTADPASGLNVLCVSDAMRAYYGDPQDEAYRAFRRQLVRFGDNQDWLKQASFTNDTIAVEVDRMHQIQQWEREDAQAVGPSPTPPGPPEQNVVLTTPGQTELTASLTRGEAPRRPATSQPQPTSGRARATALASNYRMKMQQDFKARKEL